MSQTSSRSIDHYAEAFTSGVQAKRLYLDIEKILHRAPVFPHLSKWPLFGPLHCAPTGWDVQ